MISNPIEWIIFELDEWFLSEENIQPKQVVRSDAVFADEVQKGYLDVLNGDQTYESFLLYSKNDLRTLSVDGFGFLLPKIVTVALQNPRSELMDYFIYIVSDLKAGLDYYDCVFRALDVRRIHILCMAIMMFGVIYCGKDDFLFAKINRACFLLIGCNNEMILRPK